MHDAEKQKNYERAEKLISEQNFAAAVIAGAVATLLAAIACGITVSTWPFSYAFATVAIGIVVGISMQLTGRGISGKFAVLAAIYTLAGCVLGNLFVKVASQAQSPGITVIDVFRNNPLPELAGWSVSGLSLMDIFFWLIAVWFAVFLVRRPLSRSDRLALGLFERRH